MQCKNNILYAHKSEDSQIYLISILDVLEHLISMELVRESLLRDTSTFQIYFSSSDSQIKYSLLDLLRGSDVRRMEYRKAPKYQSKYESLTIKSNNFALEYLFLFKPKGIGLIFENKLLEYFLLSVAISIFGIVGTAYLISLVSGKILIIETSLRNTVEEKNSLLLEVHHRVKNNLQVIISLLNLRFRRLSNPEVRQIFQESINRIRSISTVHELLYSVGLSSVVDLKLYTEKLVHNLAEVDAKMKKVEFDLDIDEITVDIDKASSLGIMINELCVNTMKHAFCDSNLKERCIAIGIHKVANSKIKLQYSDNGRGIADERETSDSSLGLKLITRLAKQIDGEVTFPDSKTGFKFELIFSN